MGWGHKRQSPIRLKMKKLRQTVRGRIVTGSPQGETERRVWEEMGYKQLPTGEWYEADDQNPGPSLEFMRRYPHGHVCKACRDHFRRTKYHDAFCQSCRSIVELDRQKIESILGADSDGGQEVREDTFYQIQFALECPRCGWQANEGRIEPRDTQRIREYLGGWLEAAHIHWMRHNFWNRFSTRPKSISKEDWQEEMESKKLFTALMEYERKSPNIIEITYSETGIPLYAEQKHSKCGLQFPIPG
jgi:hypothetical protein